MAPAADSLVAVMRALWFGATADYARRLAKFAPKSREEVERDDNPVSVQQLVRLIVQTIIVTLGLARTWAWEVELATLFEVELSGEETVTFFLARADGVVLLGTDRHANLVTAVLTNENKRFMGGSWLVEGVKQGLQQAALRLMHLVSLRRARYGAKWWAPEHGDPLVAYGTVTDGFTLYVLCVEVEVKKDMPRLKWRLSNALPLWSPAFMAAAKRPMGSGEYAGAVMPGGPRLGKEPGAGLPRSSQAPAGLVALVALLSADRSFLGPVPYLLPPNLSFRKCDPSGGAAATAPGAAAAAAAATTSAAAATAPAATTTTSAAATTTTPTAAAVAATDAATAAATAAVGGGSDGGSSSMYPMPPLDAWQHLGSGGASEAYQTRDGLGQFLVVKVSRHPANTQQSLSEESTRYLKLGTGCMAIPQLVAIAFAGGDAAAAGATVDNTARGAPAGGAGGAAARAAVDGAAAATQHVAAIVLTPGTGVHATLPVWDVLSRHSGFYRAAYALLAVYSVAVALAHAHSRRVSHNDVRRHNVVWIVRTKPELTAASSVDTVLAAAVEGVLPGVEAVGAAQRAISSHVDAAKLQTGLAVHAQLVDWGVPTAFSPARAKSDTESLWTLLAALVSEVARDTLTEAPSKGRVTAMLAPVAPTSVVELLATLQPPREVRQVDLKRRLKALQSATQLGNAIRAILDILACVLQAADDWRRADASRALAAAAAAATAEVAAVAAAAAAPAAEAEAEAEAEAPAAAAAAGSSASGRRQRPRLR